MQGTIRGACLCGEVTFEVAGEAVNVANCHCTRCRRSTGAAFNTVVLFREGDFRVVAGAEQLRTYALSERASKHFCPQCGTEIYHRNRQLPGMVIVPLGACDEPARFVPSLNVYCESMLPWVGVISAMTSFSRGVKG